MKWLNIKKKEKNISLDSGQKTKSPVAGAKFSALCCPFLTGKGILLLSFLIFVLFFLTSRLPFFLYYPVAGFNIDTPGYYMIVDQINKGFWPEFAIRTPGYPLFLKLVFTFFKSNLAVILIQNMLTFFTCLFFIYAINRAFRDKLKYLPLLTAFGLGAFVSSTIHLLSDATLLTESLYVNLLILFFAFLILGVYFKRRRYWALCSFIMAAAILVRASGMFFVFIFVFILFYLFRRSFSRSTIVVFFTPFVSILFLMALYNYITVGSFSISCAGEQSLISYTSTFLTPDETYAPRMNEAIEACRKILKKRDEKILKNSWNITKLRRVFHKYYNYNRILIGNTLLAKEKEDVYNLYLKWRPHWKKAAVDAILKHPGIYLKLVCTQFIGYFFHRHHDAVFRIFHNYRKVAQDSHEITYTLRKMFSQFSLKKGEFSRKYNSKEYAETLSEDFTRSMLKEDYELRTFSKAKLAKQKNAHRVFKAVHNFLFRNIIWVFLFFMTFIFSFYTTIKSKLLDSGSFIYFIMGLSVILHAGLYSLSSKITLRYTYPLEFVYFLSPLFFLIIYNGFIKKGRQPQPKTPLRGET